MTLIKEVEMGEDIKEAFAKCKCYYNLTNTEINKIDNDKLYFVKKHCGFYPSQNKSGLFLLFIKEVTDKFIEESL